MLNRCAIAALTLFSIPAFAGTVQVDYIGSFVQGQSGDQGLPLLLNGTTDHVKLEFFVPDYQLLVGLNSVRVAVRLFDDGDAASEDGNIKFVLSNQPNLSLDSFSGLNGYTSGSPYRDVSFVSAGDFAAVLSEIQQDGTFFIRVNRTAGDFNVKSASVRIDGVLAPEPSGIVFTAMGLGLGVMTIRRRKARTA